MNRYLQGNFAPVADEVTATDLPVTGRLPVELNGLLLRNGPNPITVENPATYHWFSGDGMVHGIELQDGRALSYRNRWVRTDGAAARLGEPTPDGPTDVFPMGSSVANTNVMAHAGRIFALVEVALPTELRTDLTTVGRYDFDGRLRSPMTAHPKIDAATGEMLFFGYDIFGPPWLRFHVVSADGELVRSEEIEIRGPAMVHDFAVTESHVVFFDLPVVFDMDLAAQGFFPFSWQPETYGARVGVMPRSGGGADVRWFDVEPCYVFHPLNAYDDGDRVVVDVVRHATMFAGDRNGPSGGAPTLDRWMIDLAGGKVLEERLSDHEQEFPRIDDRLTGRRHRYGYGTYFGTDDSGLRLGGLLKHDLVVGTTEVHDFGAGRQAGEGVFVPGGAGEDEGWVLSVVYDPATDGSELAVLDATDFRAPPVASIRLPQRVPFGFHGNWVPAGDR
ncbi:MAG TPA: carotenoid oxygenase family protein [Acidimicrobiales bacterium]|nr:carotenoid oxygenase family protein [Acidimicrobiales bacterium]